MTTAERANPFGDLAQDFAPKKAPAKPVEAAQIERLAEDHGFPSRQQPAALQAAAQQPAQRARRRYTTGRNQQINIKATSETLELFYRMADERNVPLGELLERALHALETVDAAQK